MSFSPSSRPRSWSRLAFLALAAALWMAPGPLRADDTACTVPSFSGDRRPCTASEEFGRCAGWAQEAYWRCARSSSKIGLLRCAFFLDIDIVVCATSSGVGGVFGPLLRS